MTSQDIEQEIGKPELLKLQQVNEGLKIGQVFGRRILVEPVGSLTYLEKLHRLGTLVIPEALKKMYAPKRSTGIIVKLGSGVAVEDGLVEGAMVLFSKHAGLDVGVDLDENDESKGHRYVVLHVDDIACTLEPTGGNINEVVQLVEEDHTPDVPVRAGEALIR